MDGSVGGLAKTEDPLENAAVVQRPGPNLIQRKIVMMAGWRYQECCCMDDSKSRFWEQNGIFVPLHAGFRPVSDQYPKFCPLNFHRLVAVGPH